MGGIISWRVTKSEESCQPAANPFFALMMENKKLSAKGAVSRSSSQCDNTS